MNTTTKTLFALAGMALIAGSAQAAPITVTNHSFEDDGVDTSTPAGWNTVGNGINANGGWFNDPMPDGTFFAWTNQSSEYHRQTLVDTLQANTTYTLTVATGWRNDLQGAGYTNYPGYRIELWAGGSMIAFDADTTNGGTGSALAAGEWRDVVATVTTGAVVTPGQALEIRLEGGQSVNNGNTTAIQTNYDNVRLDATLVPEPGSLALLGLGGLLIARRRRA